MFKRILVGIDTSVATQHAFADALSIAKATDASLHLMHVFSWDDAYDKCLAMLYSELQEIDNNEALIEHDPPLECLISQYRGHEQPETLIKYQADAQKAGVQAEIEPPRRGRPGINLCRAAKIEQADLIAVGHRDKDVGEMLGLGELHLGSVSYEVIHRASCSVLISHRADVAVEPLKKIDQIMAAIDDSIMSQFVFQESLDLAKATGAHLILVNVLSPSENSRPPENLQIFQDRATAVGVPVHVKQLSSASHSIGRVICEFAHQQKTDLILVGRRRLLELQEQVLGSVSHYVAYHTPCTAIIIQSS
jgi:nucleotide-binding universal stress UspA family protein